MRVIEMESSKSGSYFLTAEFEKKVAAYESATGRKFGEYDTHFTSGGKRMCIADSGKYFAAAAYSRFGITLFDAETGSPLWTTKEVKRVQRIRFTDDDTKLLAINNDNILYTISTADGSIISVEKGIQKIFPDSLLEVKLTSRNQLKWNGASVSIGNIVLGICSGNGRVFCSIMGGGLKCFSDGGSELWSVENKPEEHYIKLGYCSKYDYIIGLGYKYGAERTEPFHFLDVYSAANGAAVCSVGLNENSYDYTLINGAEGIVSGDGDVYILEQDCFTMNEKQINM